MLARSPVPWLLLIAATSCNWLGLARHSLTYRTTARGEAASLVPSVAGDVLFVTLGEDGFAVVDPVTGAILSAMSPPAGAGSVDDIAVAGDLLFALDARPPGYLAVYALEDVRQPRQIGPARSVPVGPFSGVAAAAGMCIVSGGTSALTLWRYDDRGVLEGPVDSGDYGRGQPDVLLSAAEPLAIVSTHYWGPYFGLDVVRYDTAGRLDLLAELELAGAGFTAGGAKPAGFPLAIAALHPGTVLVAYGRGLGIIDLADAMHPRLLRTLALDGPAVSLAVQGSTALVAVAGSRPALVLLDFAGSHETGRRRIPLAPGTIPAGVALTGTRAAVALGPRGVQLFPR